MAENDNFRKKRRLSLQLVLPLQVQFPLVAGKWSLVFRGWENVSPSLTSVQLMGWKEPACLPPGAGLDRLERSPQRPGRNRTRSPGRRCACSLPPLLPSEEPVASVIVLPGEPQPRFLLPPFLGAMLVHRDLKMPVLGSMTPRPPGTL